MYNSNNYNNPNNRYNNQNQYYNNQRNDNGNNFQNRPQIQYNMQQNMRFMNTNNPTVINQCNNNYQNTQGYYSSSEISGDFKKELKFILDTYKDNNEHISSELEIKRNNLKKEFNKTIKKENKKNQTITIPEFRLKLQNIDFLNNDLRENLLKRSIDESNLIQNKIELLKTELTPTIVIKMKSKMKAIENKRKRIKRVKKRICDERREEDQMRKDIHERIDQRLENILSHADNKRKVKEMKLSTDKVMVTIVTRLQDVKNDLKFLDALVQLRDANKIFNLNRGIVCKGMNDTAFQTKLNNMKTISMQQCNLYESQINKLEVIQEKERINEIDQKQEIEFNYKLNKTKNILFGDLHKSRDIDIKSLIEIRREWDFYLTGTDMDLSLTIPPQYVVPVNPSDSVWKEYIVDADN